ncbi:hypothetical protein BDE02_13G061400 [Populus trichocarpa]|nr:hypothetical protein BDE02_13G061400 [Populus trichocarpa]
MIEILRRLPTDGLIKREGPLSRLKGSVMFIIAMMNATDRWPLTLLMAIIATQAGSCLLCNWATSRIPLFLFWPLFTLSHHMVVWLAAERLYPGRRFQAYAVLGDDIVIAGCF